MEKKDFLIKFILLSIVVIAACTAVGALISGGTAAAIVVVCGMIISFSGGFFAYRRIDKAYDEIEKISHIMEDVMEDESTTWSDPLEEGSVGILYSNFGKMVHMFREGKRKEQSEKDFLKDIMSDISHQLKTPLASLNVFIDLLLEDKVEGKEERLKILREASNQLDRMEWMVLSMLKLARIEAKAIEFERKEAYIQPVLLQVEESVRYLTDVKNQKLIVKCPEDVTAKLDSEWLTEAIINLAKNASDYSPEGAEIILSAEQDDVFTRIYVEDNGVGIDEKDLPNIFRRFYRVNSSVNPNSVGIGLSLTKSIIEGMDGHIHVDSKVGEGTRFSITF
ncbi:MAG: HAMP domain-containing histidine kinase [Eubacterium sp.]|nr:HAMP domain-containing histidine kinase [Eubacterium sp.]